MGNKIFGSRIKDEKEVMQAITFVDKGTRTKAIDKIEHNVNGPRKFAIMKTTENGKYVRSGFIYYSINGVDVYAAIDDIIFVDLDNNTLFIKANTKIENEINPVDPEQRQYVILYTDLGYESEDGDFPLRWESVTGRTNAYENIKVNAPVIDIDKSIVLVDTVALKDSLTVREFMNYLKNSEIIVDESFDINDFEGEYV
jgi:hypothetical protein